MMTAVAKRTDAINEILEGSAAGFYVSYCEMPKNGIRKPALVLRSEEHNCCPVLYIDSQIEQMSDPDLASYLEVYHDAHAKDVGLGFLEKDEVLSRILPRLESAEHIPEIQEAGICYQPYMDMVIRYYIPLPELGTEGGIGNLQVSEAMLKSLDISMNEAYQHACENQVPDITLESMNDVLEKLTGVSVPAVPAQQMLIVSNRSNCFGAAAILSKYVLEEARMRLGTDRMACIPSSIHEMILVECNDEEGLYQMNATVNETTVEEEELLTTNIYVYEDGQLTAYK